jgi:hypothetical protein
VIKLAEGRLRNLSFSALISMLSILFVSDLNSSDSAFSFRYKFYFPASDSKVIDVETDRALKLRDMNKLQEDGIPSLAVVLNLNSKNQSGINKTMISPKLQQGFGDFTAKGDKESGVVMHVESNDGVGDREFEAINRDSESPQEPPAVRPSPPSNIFSRAEIVIRGQIGPPRIS